ncbi:MAG TPA: hypothetical protein VL334_07585 [Anaerolineae bacterium]|nr:hypothetical protein [Anaerolineae bacterium]
MSKRDDYRQTLRKLSEWEPYLLAESGLPGPRGNIELAQAVADEGDETLFLRLLSFNADVAPTNTPQEFLAFCGMVGLGRLLAEGRHDLLPALRLHANDSRWRSREGVAMALQRWGRVDMDGLLAETDLWSQGTFLEQRAAAAALCEPALLRDPAHVERTLQILDAITAAVAQSQDRHSEAFQALRKGLAYCWSVAVAALPDVGKPMMERWLASDDRDVRWIMRQNLAKQRLVRIDAGWVATYLLRLDG